MKKLVLIASFVFASVFSYSQVEGYMNAGYAGLKTKDDYSSGVFLGGGAYLSKTISVGLNMDFLNIDQDKTSKYAIGSVDFRVNKGAFYLALQPGYVLYNKNIQGVQTKGSYSGVALLGARWKMFTVAAGYQNVGFKTNDNTERSGAFRFNVGLELN